MGSNLAVESRTQLADSPHPLPRSAVRFSWRIVLRFFRRTMPAASVAWLYKAVELARPAKDDVGWLRHTVTVEGLDGPEEWVAEGPILTTQLKTVGGTYVLDAQAVIMPPAVRRVLPPHEVIRIPVGRMIAINEKILTAIAAAKAKEAAAQAARIAEWRRKC